MNIPKNFNADLPLEHTMETKKVRLSLWFLSFNRKEKAVYRNK